MGKKVRDEDRKHKKHMYLKPLDEAHLHQVLKLRMLECVGTERLSQGWEYVEGWSAARVAKTEGTPFTNHNVRNFRNKHYPEPTSLVTAHEPKAAGIEHEVAETSTDVQRLLQDLADHRANTANILDEIMAELASIKKITLAIAKEWKLVE